MILTLLIATCALALSALGALLAAIFLPEEPVPTWLPPDRRPEPRPIYDWEREGI